MPALSIALFSKEHRFASRSDASLATLRSDARATYRTHPLRSDNPGAPRIFFTGVKDLLRKGAGLSLRSEDGDGGSAGVVPLYGDRPKPTSEC